MPSLIQILHGVPTLLGTASPAALKAFSATCRSLRTSFRAQAKVMSLSFEEDAAKLCCTTWPQLLMVVCVSKAQLKTSSSQMS